MKILLAVDGSAFTKRMLAYLAAHDELLGTACEYIAITVVRSITGRAAHFLGRQLLEEYYREEAEAVLQPVQAFAKMQAWSLRVLKTHGHAAETISEVARDENVDLIVMGSHGYSALSNMIMGSVAMSVIARSSVPILLIR